MDRTWNIKKRGALTDMSIMYFLPEILGLDYKSQDPWLVKRGPALLTLRGLLFSRKWSSMSLWVETLRRILTGGTEFLLGPIPSPFKCYFGSWVKKGAEVQCTRCNTHLEALSVEALISTTSRHSHFPKVRRDCLFQGGSGSSSWNVHAESMGACSRRTVPAIAVLNQPSKDVCLNIYCLL